MESPVEKKAGGSKEAIRIGVTGYLFINLSCE
jgi:hypothetical protein